MRSWWARIRRSKASRSPLRLRSMRAPSGGSTVTRGSPEPASIGYPSAAICALVASCIRPIKRTPDYGVPELPANFRCEGRSFRTDGMASSLSTPHLHVRMLSARSFSVQSLAGVSEAEDDSVSKTDGGNPVRVRVPPPAPAAMEFLPTCPLGFPHRLRQPLQSPHRRGQDPEEGQQAADCRHDHRRPQPEEFA